jgi:hypothetical protein
MFCPYSQGRAILRDLNLDCTLRTARDPFHVSRIFFAGRCVERRSIQPDLAKQIDDWQRKQEDLPGRPEALRRLAEIGLKAKQPKG